LNKHYDSLGDLVLLQIENDSNVLFLSNLVLRTSSRARQRVITVITVIVASMIKEDFSPQEREAHSLSSNSLLKAS